MSEIMHVLLKYNDTIYNVDTIAEHKSIESKENQVIWGIIKPSETSPGVGSSKINKIKQQISDGNLTYVFFATGGRITNIGLIKDILSNEEVFSKKNLVPEYYHKDINRCVSGLLIEKIDKINPNIINDLQRYQSNRGNVALGNLTNPLYVSFADDVDTSLNYSNNNVEDHIEVIIEQTEDNLNNNSIVKEFNSNLIKRTEEYMRSKGFIFPYEDLCNYYLSLRTKPFVILAGISGTGKSRLVEIFSEAVGATVENGQLCVISVKPDWSDNTELFGYKTINEKYVPGELTSFIYEASKYTNKDKPFFVCLDEMNLARVEHYFSDYLSLLESRKNVNGEFKTNKIFPDEYFNGESKYSGLSIPENLYIVGTVNMDDTTYSFSKKVLDRANTIEFSEIRLDIMDFPDNYIEPKLFNNSVFKSKYLSIKEALKDDREFVLGINKKIIDINEILAVYNRHFGYRIRDQIVFYMIENKNLGLLHEDEAFDYQIMQKILPQIAGSDNGIKKILVELYNFCNPQNKILSDINYLDEAETNIEDAVYMKSAKKIVAMLRGFSDGYASFW